MDHSEVPWSQSLDVGKKERNASSIRAWLGVLILMQSAPPLLPPLESWRSVCRLDASISGHPHEYYPPPRQVSHRPRDTAGSRIGGWPGIRIAIRQSSRNRMPLRRMWFVYVQHRSRSLAMGRKANGGGQLCLPRKRRGAFASSFVPSDITPSLLGLLAVRRLFLALWLPLCIKA